MDETQGHFSAISGHGNMCIANLTRLSRVEFQIESAPYNNEITCLRGNGASMMTSDGSLRSMSRTAGIYYLGTIITGVFAAFFAIGDVMVSRDAAATAVNLVASESLYRWGIAAELASALCYVGVTCYFFEIFKLVDRRLSLLAAMMSLTGSAVLAGNTLNLIAPLLLLSGAEYLAPLPTDQVQALSLFFLKLHGYGYATCLIFFGFYCLLIGYLIIKGKQVPVAIGLAMILGGLSYLLLSIADIVSPALYEILPAYTTVTALIAELALCLWLIMFGVNTKQDMKETE
ncbi:MAG: DUF4386 domain-containing protein [Chakrabartia sp.]